jgi:hypothetical protein
VPLSPHLRERILRQLDQLSDDKAYHVLDYAEFLSSRYAEKSAPSANIFTKFTEGVEDTMRAGRVSTTAIAETMGLLNKAMGVLNGVAAAGKSVASEIASAATGTAKPGSEGSPPPADGAGSPPVGDK